MYTAHPKNLKFYFTVITIITFWDLSVIDCIDWCWIVSLFDGFTNLLCYTTGTKLCRTKWNVVGCYFKAISRLLQVSSRLLWIAPIFALLTVAILHNFEHPVLILIFPFPSIFFLFLFRSPTLYRAFYIPFLSNQKNIYANYVLLKSKTWKIDVRKSKASDFEYDDPDEFEGINE